jgi:hypothetical protein
MCGCSRSIATRVPQAFDDASCRVRAVTSLAVTIPRLFAREPVQVRRPHGTRRRVGAEDLHLLSTYGRTMEEDIFGESAQLFEFSGFSWSG